MRSSKTLEFCTSSYNILAVFAVESEGNIPKADKRAGDGFEGDTSMRIEFFTHILVEETQVTEHEFGMW